MEPLRYRQIHLDFHTSEAIEGIGADFDKAHWQRTLREGHVDSINIFAVCHHGWSYYDTKVGTRHPHLKYDLTRAMYEACKDDGVKAPIYITVGVNNHVAHEHPEWRVMAEGGYYYGWSTKTTDAGFHALCFNTPYLDYVCAQIQEVATLFPQCDGLWLDIIHEPQCCCRWCLDSMVKLNLDPKVEADRVQHAAIVLDTYYRRTLAALREVSPTMPIFQNSGHVQRGKRSFFDYVSHLELESLPTWFWGYDHFPMSAKYAKLSGLDFLGMTGKFHTTWGEFGGYKHPNALRYECAAMLAYGGKCCVGDQLHPRGLLDESTYRVIGQAYAEVEAKEPWCNDTTNLADVAILSSVAVNPAFPRQDDSDTGAARILFEGHVLFDIIDGEMDFAQYRALVLPDDVIVSDALKSKLDAYLAAGGKLLLTGTSGLAADGKTPLFDLGADVVGNSEFELDFMLPVKDLRPDFVDSPFVVYARYPRIRTTSGQSLGQIHDPYFNRTWRHFCSHQHAPARPEPSGYDCGVHKGSILYVPAPIFRAYRALGVVAYKDFVLKCLRRLLGGALTVEAKLPSTARVTLTEQKEQDRYVLHLLAPTLVLRGGVMKEAGSLTTAGRAIEVIEDLIPLHNVDLSLKLDAPVTRATLEPQGEEIPVRTENGRTVLTVPVVECHQMVALHR